MVTYADRVLVHRFPLFFASRFFMRCAFVPIEPVEVAHSHGKIERAHVILEFLVVSLWVETLEDMMYYGT